MKDAVDRLETLFSERATLIERYAQLWAVHGGGSSTWEHHLVDIDTAPIEAQIRRQRGDHAKEAEIKLALRLVPEYTERVQSTMDGRKEWAMVREQMTTLTWRIQLELAKLRLQLGDEATPTGTALPEGE